MFLEVDRVTKSFRGIVAVKDLSFSIQKGDIVGLIGPNGAGKTTAFNIVAGVYKPDSGQVRFEGKVISGKKPHKIAQLGIARTFQIVKPFPRMTTLENVLVGGLFGKDHSYSIQRERPHAIEAIRQAGLENKINTRAEELSLAEQRRLELARALAAKPDLLMLDEIMAGLNAAEISQTLGILRRLNQEDKITLLVIEHVMMAIMQLCSRIVVMSEGHLLAEGTPPEIVGNQQVVEAYMGRGRLPTRDSKNSRG